MTEWINPIGIALVVALVALALPLLALSYYTLRLGLHRSNLLAKIHECGLEEEYLRLFHFKEWQPLHDRQQQAVDRKANAAEIQAIEQSIRDAFEVAFKARFQWDNSWRNYLLPLLFTLATTTVFALVILRALLSASSLDAFLANGVLPFAIAGAMLYVFPTYISRYSSFSLNPANLLDLLAKLWLSVIIGVVTASVIVATIQPLAAFLGGLIPMASLDLLKKRVFDKQDTGGDPGENARKATMLGLVEQDQELLSQLDYVGIRSPLELAYENPLKIFVESDLNLESCIYLVDKANLYLYVPDKEIREKLNHHGIKTAVDLMTQVYEDDWIEPAAPLPPYLEKALKEIAQALGLSLEALRNMLALMKDDPKLHYLLDFWLQVTPSIEKLSEGQPATEAAAEPTAQVVAPPQTVEAPA